MPPFPERESSILAKLDSKLKDVADATGPKRVAKTLAQVTSEAVTAVAAPACELIIFYTNKCWNES